MRVDFNPNNKQNPYFGIMRFSEKAQEMIPLDRIIDLQNRHSTNSIQVFIDRSYDLVQKSRKQIIGEDDYVTHYWQERIYRNLLTATYDNNGKKVIMKENPIINFIFGHERFLKKVFEKTQKIFYTGSN